MNIVKNSSTTAIMAFSVTATLLSLSSSQAAITIVSGLTTGAPVGTEVAKGGITVTGASTNGAVSQNLVNGDISDAFPGGVWFDGGAPTTTTLNFDFGTTVQVSSFTINFAWSDRDDMTYDMQVGGVSQGVFSVANGSTGAFPGEPETTFIFDSPFAASSVDLVLTDIIAGGTANEASPAIAEVTFHAIPEPSTAVLVAIAGLSLGLRRRAVRFGATCR
ncbi:MAG: PEP-CTERM sorting domain-containing protein [Akkermansiaceae bacterium]|nr:PEP-CTERM sorting domain-containing protein [Akkermansiaceae bacterium]